MASNLNLENAKRQILENMVCVIQVACLRV